MDYNTNTYTLEKVCSAAAIYGLDGSCWAFSPNFPELKDYPFELEGMDGGKQTIQVSELGSAIAAANGTRNPTAAGIRMGGEKFMLTVHEEDRRAAQLKKMGGGGAAVALTTTGIVIAFYEKETNMSNGKVQNGSNCADQAAAMAAYLTEQGY